MIKDALDFVKHRKQKIYKNISEKEIIDFISSVLHINKENIEIKNIDENIIVLYIYDIIQLKNLVEFYNIVNDNTIYIMSSSHMIKIYVSFNCIYNVIKNGNK